MKSRKLVEHRETVFKQQQNTSSDNATPTQKITRSSSRSSGKHRVAPPPPMRTEETPTPQSPNTARSPVTKKNSRNAKSVSSPAKERKQDEQARPRTMSLEERLSSPTPAQSSSVPSKLGEELVELVRVRTGLSYAKSMDALSAVFGHIRDTVPPVGDTMEQILQSLHRMSVSLLVC